ncbi:MAG: nucleoside phosphorylase [Clostridiales bacterium]|nr:nucleoside phosphorylase [Clostridiales bacterium]
MSLNFYKNDVLTDPKKLVARELKNAGFDINTMKIPSRVYLLADSLYGIVLSKNCGKYKYPLGGDLFVFNDNDSVGFIKGMMCSPAIATQAEDLIAGGVKELIHIGFAGGLQQNMRVGDIVLTDGAYNDTAVARLYGFDYDFIESTKSLTDDLQNLLTHNGINFMRGKHWTTDAGYMETYGQLVEHRDKGALCVEMEGVGLFAVANYRKCRSSAIYVISDVHRENDWNLGWGENMLDTAINKLINIIISSTN